MLMDGFCCKRWAKDVDDQWRPKGIAFEIAFLPRLHRRRCRLGGVFRDVEVNIECGPDLYHYTAAANAMAPLL